MSKLVLHYPLNPYRVNQPFGVNGEYYRANKINVDGHNGIDLGAYHGQPIYASHDGIAYYEVDDKGGHGVVIVTDKAYDYKGGLAFFKTIDWHMCDPKKEPQYASPIYLAVGKKTNSNKGVPVKAGDLIGYADSTGLSSGDHCHWGLKPIKSGKAPASGDAPDIGIGSWVNLEPNNGYLGAIDPTPYLSGTYAQDVPNIQAQISIIQKLIALFTSGKK